MAFITTFYELIFAIFIEDVRVIAFSRKFREFICFETTPPMQLAVVPKIWTMC